MASVIISPMGKLREWFRRPDPKKDEVPDLCREILRKEVLIMSKIEEVAGLINTALGQFEKAKGEIVAKIDSLQTRVTELEAALANTEIPADAQTALAALKAEAQSFDDVVPDVPAEPPV